MKIVYFMRPRGEVGPIKIGSSKLPAKRLLAYQIWSPVVLEMAAYAEAHHNAEVWLHRHFLDEWMHGEWFRASDRLRALVDHVADQHALPEWVDPPKNPSEYRAFLARYPLGVPKRTSTRADRPDSGASDAHKAAA